MDHLATHPARGAIFESWVFSELLNLENAVELVNPPDRLLLSILDVFPGHPIGAQKIADVAQLQGARCDGMAHAISSFVQRRRWVASAVFRLKGRYQRGESANLFFWRNHVGVEIDLLADHGQTLLPIECKSGATIAGDWFSGLTR